MTDRITFLTDLKSLGNRYLAHPLTRFKSRFNQSSSESQKLAYTLSNLNPTHINALPIAVQAIVTFIKIKKSYETTRRFWDNYIFPEIITLAKSPIENLPPTNKPILQQIEFPEQYFEGTDFTFDSINLLFTGLGYGDTVVERHPTLINKYLKTSAGCDKVRELMIQPGSPFSVYSGRILGYYFMHMQNNIPDPLEVYPFIGTCLLHPNPKGLKIAFKHIPTNNPAVQKILPDLLEALCKTSIPYTINIFGTAETNYTAEEIMAFQNDKIQCLRELKRAGLEPLTLPRLRALVTSTSVHFYQGSADYQTVAREILSNQQWSVALQTSGGAIELSKLLDEQTSRALVLAIDNEKKVKLGFHP